MSKHFQLAIIGGGTAAITAILHALSLDVDVRSVALIEARSSLGGECALNACVPTKTLLTAAKAMNQIRFKDEQYGIQVEGFRVDFPTLMRKVHEVIEEGEYAFLKDERVTVYHGHAHFDGMNSVVIPELSMRITADKFIIASGAEPLPLKIPGADELGYLTFQQATHLETLPASIAILGAGPVGVEFAYIFSALGVNVTLLQKGEALLPNEEPEVQQAVQVMLEKQGVQVYTDIRLPRMSQGVNAAKRVEFYVSADGAVVVDCDEVLSAIGMQPRVLELALETANIRFSTQEGIDVNTQMHTSNPNVWAVGDVASQYAFTHIADYQAEVAVENALLDAHRAVDYYGIGWAIYTEPSVAHVGMTQAEAERHYPEVDTVLCSTAEVSRYRIESETDGLIKVVIDRQSQRLLGVHMVASGAEELAHMVLLAIRQGLTCEELVVGMPYIYPSRSQLIQKALEKYLALKADREAEAHSESSSQGSRESLLPSHSM